MRRLTAALVIAGLAAAPLLTSSFGVNGRGGGQAAATQPVTLPGAARFLTQATFGPTDSSISDVQSAGYAAWIDQQESMPVSDTHLAFMQRRLAALQAVSPSARNTSADFYDSFWRQTATAPDQLRQRVKLALSEIFVISFNGQILDPKGVASYYDVLGANAFGNYRTLLEQVNLHPMMGSYLTYISNAKENPVTDQNPDENFAREIQQLMSIGLYQLNQDGSNQADSSGAAIPTYSDADIKGLSKVFTGFGWFSAHTTGYGSPLYFYGVHKDPNAYVTSMSAYPAMHSTSEKSFLGTTISASTTPDPTGDLKIALDTIFNQPNVGPFIGKQLIQRLVTSNPSPAYIARVAAVFNNDGTGVRGNLGAVVKAILMDPEARDDTAVSNPTFGKLREPVVRLGNWMRAFNATSDSGWWLAGSTSALVSFNQSPLTAPSVFNFWRPGYSPPNTTMGGLNLVAPEFQTVNVISVASYLNAIRLAVNGGVGAKSTTTGGPDVHSAYVNEMAIASNAGALADRINTLVLYGQMSASLRTRIITAVNKIKVPGPPATTTLVNNALKSRVVTAVYMAFGSPEYMAQR
jgi:uncharacterized protein (DUF1800 family)